MMDSLCINNFLGNVLMTIKLCINVNNFFSDVLMMIKLCINKC